MQVTRTKSGSEAVFTVVASESELGAMKRHVLTHFQGRVKVPGFRAGKAPDAILEKHISPEQLQSDFLQEAVEQMYYRAVDELKLRTLEQPKVSIKKFVPYTTLEFEATVNVIGGIKLADYKSVKKKMPEVKVGADDVNGVIKSLQERLADKQEVNRAAKDGDEVWIDFTGRDKKGQPVNGADGKDYPLRVGSKTFIPGFEDNVLGLKPNNEKEFTLTFPKDYQVKALANKSVIFSVKVKKVHELKQLKANDEFAKKAGPFTTLKQLKDDIKKQLELEQATQAKQQFESELVRDISVRSSLDVPEVLIDDQREQMLRQLKQNLVYRGQTYEEFLKNEGKTEEQYKKDVLRSDAIERVRASLVLSEIAEAEQLSVTPEELDQRITELKSQYKDQAMLEELDKPDARRDIAARILTDKTVAKLVAYATAK